MQMSGTDQAFWVAGFLGEVLLFLVLLARRQYRIFPIFVVWVLLIAIEDPALYWFSQHASTFIYYRNYTILQALDFIIQFGVLVEIAHSVLKPAEPRIPNKTLSGLATGLLLCFLLVVTWVLHQNSGSHQLLRVFNKVESLNFVFAFLRLVLFAAIAGFSQMLGITWRNHVVRLAAGLAFYSAVSLIVQLTLSHLSQSNPESYTRDYWLLNHTQVIAFIGALTFWVWSFVQKDAPRREFTPQMQKVLVTISQAARRNRVSLTRSMGHK